MYTNTEVMYIGQAAGDPVKMTSLVCLLVHTHYSYVDDGSLSLEEFLAYFGDGVLSNGQLEDIFRQIDTHHTK